MSEKEKLLGEDEDVSFAPEWRTNCCVLIGIVVATTVSAIIIFGLAINLFVQAYECSVDENDRLINSTFAIHVTYIAWCTITYMIGNTIFYIHAILLKREFVRPSTSSSVRRSILSLVILAILLPTSSFYLVMAHFHSCERNGVTFSLIAYFLTGYACIAYPVVLLYFMGKFEEIGVAWGILHDKGYFLREKDDEEKKDCLVHNSV